MQEAIISSAQMRMMYGLAKECGMDNDDLHSVVMLVTNKDSIRALSKYEAKRTIDYLLHKSGQEKPNIPNRATENQKTMIHTIATKLGMMEEPRQFRAFLENRFGVADIAFLTREKTQAVITALKAMEQRQAKAFRPPPGMDA